MYLFPLAIVLSVHQFTAQITPLAQCIFFLWPLFCLSINLQPQITPLAQCIFFLWPLFCLSINLQPQITPIAQCIFNLLFFPFSKYLRKCDYIKEKKILEEFRIFMSLTARYLFIDVKATNKI